MATQIILTVRVRITSKDITILPCGQSTVVKCPCEIIIIGVTITTVTTVHRGLRAICTCRCKCPTTISVGCKFSHKKWSISVEIATKIMHPAKCHWTRNWRSVSIDVICAIDASGWATFAAWTTTKMTPNSNTIEFSEVHLCVCAKCVQSVTHRRCHEMIIHEKWINLFEYSIPTQHVNIWIWVRLYTVQYSHTFHFYFIFCYFLKCLFV